MLIGLTFLFGSAALCGMGAFAIANTICQARWKEKIPQGKLAGFAAIFAVVFVTLVILLMFASATVFGR
jgi:uncharacterized membrane protein YidH (DUF202 family)